MQKTRARDCRAGLVALVVASSVLAGGGCKKARDWAQKKGEEQREERRTAAAVHAQEAPRVVARPEGPGLAPGVYKLVEVRAEAQPTNRKGKAWDDAPGEDPDLEISISVDGEQVASCDAGRDTVVGRCKLKRDVRIDSASRIELTVMDEDPVLDDVIGAATLGDPARWGLGMALPLIPTGRLRAASVMFARPTTWWTVHRHRLLGLGAGVALALAVVASLRQSLMPPPPPPPPVPRCSYCAAVLAVSATSCASCGGVRKEQS